MANPKPNTSGLRRGRSGLKNKNLSITKLREQFLSAFDTLGGVEKLVQYAKSSDRAYAQFLGVISGLMPKAQEISMEVTQKDLSERLIAAREKAAQLYGNQSKTIEITNQGHIQPVPND